MQFYKIGDLVEVNGNFYRVVAELPDGRNIATPLTEKEYLELQEIMLGCKRPYAIALPYFEYEIDEY